MAEALPGLAPAIDCHRLQPLEHWQLCATAADACTHPEQLPTDQCWQPALVPGTVALSADTRNGALCDAQDWWYRCHFGQVEISPGGRIRLRCDGLATLAEVWLNGTSILSAHNMFIGHVVELAPALLREHNELYIRFRSLDAALEARRPRPRWKTALTKHQQLRWFRTTLLGRMPGWSPPTAPVGPWRPIHLEHIERIEVAALDLQTRAVAGTGFVALDAELIHAEDAAVQTAYLHIGARKYPLLPARTDNGTRLQAELNIAAAPLWWPHTHGVPQLLQCHIELQGDGYSTRIDCGRIGFKELQLDRSDGRVQLIVNGVPVFCRGACWTVNDFASLVGTPAQLRRALELARAAGANMLRIGGTMVYEADEFYRLCDELGLLVWQDFMFANMDYPVEDAQFAADIDAEVRYQLNRLQKHPCIAVYCGGSEVEQQAAMLGLPATDWSNVFFRETLPALCAEYHVDIPYFRSSPSEGALPFHVATGISHYYGVGAYRRPLSDVKHAGVKFTSECLGFSNVPEADTMELMNDGVIPVPHHPLWKARVPRDNGSGYDFEDIRDHYLQLLFGLDPVALRSTDPDRYYAISRAVSGEVMQRVYAEWRRPGSLCGGALVWFYKDLWPGAGWGIVDSENVPKAAYFYLRRAWASRTVMITDEGLNGLELHALNEAAEECSAVVELEMLQTGRTAIASATHAVRIPARGGVTLGVDALLGYFSDSAYAYRFGPPKHDAAIARLRCAETGRVLGEDVYFPLGLNLPYQDAAHVDVSAEIDAEGTVTVTITADCLLQSVCISAKHFAATDNYFHVAPRQPKSIRFTPLATATGKFRGYLSALNLRESITVRAESSA